MAQIIDMKRNGYQGSKPFRVDYFDAFKRRKRIHFKTKKEAERFLTTIEAEKLKLKEGLLPEWFFNANGERKDPTIGELYQVYLSDKIRLKPKESAQRSAEKALNGIVKQFSGIKASQLEVSQVDAYRREQLKSGKKGTSLETNINSFKAMLSWGLKHGHIIRNPLDGYTNGKKAKAEEKEALEEDEIRRFLLALRKYPDYLDYFTLGINLGTRIRELWSLEWDQVDIEKRTIYLPAEKTKTNESRKVPLNNACMDVINRLYVKKEHSPYVLWHPQSPDTITREIGRLSKRFLGKRHTPHTWRVTFASRALRGKRIRGEDGRIYWLRGDIKSVAEIGGWEPNSKILLKVYQKVNEQQKRETVGLVDIGEADLFPEPREALTRDIDTRLTPIEGKC